VTHIGAMEYTITLEEHVDGEHTVLVLRRLGQPDMEHQASVMTAALEDTEDPRAHLLRMTRDLLVSACKGDAPVLLDRARNGRHWADPREPACDD